MTKAERHRVAVAVGRARRELAAARNTDRGRWARMLARPASTSPTVVEYLNEQLLIHAVAPRVPPEFLRAACRMWDVARRCEARAGHNLLPVS